MSNFKNVAPTGIVLAPAQNQVIQFTDEAGDAIQISQQDVLQYICPNATAQEVTFYLELCRSQRLNPFKREAFLIKYGTSPASMVTAEIVFERRANAHPDYEGMSHGIVFLDSNGVVNRRNGTAVYKSLGERLIGAWCEVYRRGRKPILSEVALEEYDKHQGLWKTKAATMVDKCCKAVALREAFPSEFQGLFVTEEIGVAPSVNEIHAEVMPVENTATSDQEPVYDTVVATPEQQATFNEIVANLASLRDKEPSEVAMAVLKSKAVAATGYVVGNEMAPEQLEVAITQAQAWRDKAYSERAEEMGITVVDEETDELFDTDVDF